MSRHWQVNYMVVILRVSPQIDVPGVREHPGTGPQPLGG